MVGVLERGLSGQQKGKAVASRAICCPRLGYSDRDGQMFAGRRPPTFWSLLELSGPCREDQHGPDCEFSVIGGKAVFGFLCLWDMRQSSEAGLPSPQNLLESSHCLSAVHKCPLPTYPWPTPSRQSFCRSERAQEPGQEVRQPPTWRVSEWRGLGRGTEASRFILVPQQGAASTLSFQKSATTPWLPPGRAERVGL